MHNNAWLLCISKRMQEKILGEICLFFMHFVSFNSQKKNQTRQKCTWPICKNETQAHLALSAIMCDDGNSTLKVCLLTKTKIGVLPIFLCI